MGKTCINLDEMLVNVAYVIVFYIQGVQLLLKFLLLFINVSKIYHKMVIGDTGVCNKIHPNICKTVKFKHCQKRGHKSII